MADVKNLYKLKAPLELRDIVRNDMGEPAEYLFARPDGSEHELIGCGEDYVKRVFEPLDVESLTTQLETILEEVYEAGFTAQHEKSARRGLTILGGTSTVLELIGITKEQK
jgi:hypothetical protein